MTLDRILSCIGSTEPSDFGEFCNALGDDCPEKGDKLAWRQLFTLLGEAERAGLVSVDRVGGKIDSVILSDAGANQVRAKLDAGRPLLSADQPAGSASHPFVDSHIGRHRR